MTSFTVVEPISIPTRYAHTPLEMIDWGDVNACLELTIGMIEG